MDKLGIFYCCMELIGLIVEFKGGKLGKIVVLCVDMDVFLV